MYLQNILSELHGTTSAHNLSLDLICICIFNELYMELDSIYWYLYNREYHIYIGLISECTHICAYITYCLTLMGQSRKQFVPRPSRDYCLLPTALGFCYIYIYIYIGILYISNYILSWIAYVDIHTTGNSIYWVGTRIYTSL